MSLTVTADSPPTSLLGLISTYTVTGAARCHCGGDPRLFLKAQETLFESSGWTVVNFVFDNPITIHSYQLWVGEDYQTGNRAVRRIQIYGHLTDPNQHEFQMLSDDRLQIPYYENYGGDTVKIDKQFTTPISLQYMSLYLHCTDWGFQRAGPRLLGFQMT